MTGRRTYSSTSPRTQAPATGRWTRTRRSNSKQPRDKRTAGGECPSSLTHNTRFLPRRAAQSNRLICRDSKHALIPQSRTSAISEHATLGRLRLLARASITAWRQISASAALSTLARRTPMICAAAQRPHADPGPAPNGGYSTHRRALCQAAEAADSGLVGAWEVHRQADTPPGERICPRGDS